MEILKAERAMPMTIMGSLKKIVKPLIQEKNYYVASAFYSIDFRLLFFRNDHLILIYTPGHSGSTTIAKSLESLNLPMPILNIHKLRDESIKHYKPVPSRAIFLERYLARRLRAGWKDKNWKVVTVIREPVARNIGGFFQALDDRFLPDFVQKYEAGEIQLSDLTDMFFREYKHEFLLSWFDSQIKQAFGIDVFAAPFSKSEGYQIYRGEQVDLLVLRNEDLNRSYSRAVEEFLEIETAPLVTANAAEQKQYNHIYSAFKKTVILPDSYLDEMYGSKYARHFYSDEEIERFRTRWNRKEA